MRSLAFKASLLLALVFALGVLSLPGSAFAASSKFSILQDCTPKEC